ERGDVTADTPEDDPRRKLADTIGCLSKNVSRMDCPSDRTAGLPTMSCLIESQVERDESSCRRDRKMLGRRRLG
ncbi:hypothetical protein, partial [Novipirellula herctigrandis]|uniref:hypothetical protein n=1 Tax=Novipirellula herctigrandis TaxID=2527986 RepID=UPI003AF3A908